jgi:hypothetical protein
VCAGVAEDPASPVHVHDDWEHTRRVDRADDPDPGIADVGRHGDPLVCDGEIVDRRRLEVVEHLAGGGGLQLVEERRHRSRVDDALRRRLKDDSGLNGHADLLADG